MSDEDENADDELDDYRPENMFSNWFWSIIEKAEGNNQKLHGILSSVEQQEVIQFYREFCLAATELQGGHLAEFQAGLSEDSIDDIAEQVVSKGKSFFATTMANPSSFPRSRGENPTAFKSTALRLYRERFGHPLPH
jgi:hypothetical protein